MSKRNCITIIGLLAIVSGCGSFSTSESTASLALPLKDQGIVVRGNYAYLVIGSEIQVIDISNPAKPTLVGQVNAWMQNSEIVLIGDRIYGVNSQYPSPSRGSNRVISVIDASNPLSMSVLGVYEPTDVKEPNVYDMTVLGSTAYVMFGFRKGMAEFGEGLLVLDTQDPRNLKRLAFDTNVPLGKVVAVEASTLYTTGVNDVRIFRLNNAAQLAQVGHVCTNCQVSDIVVDGGSAYLCQRTGDKNGQFALAITRYDIRNPAAPVQKERYEITGIYGNPQTIKRASSFTIKKNRLFTTDNDGNLRIIGLGKNGNVSEVGFFDPPGWIRDVFVSDSTAYLAVGYDDMRILDISAPSSPVQKAHYSTLGYTYEENPKIVPDPLDTQPPTCTSVSQKHPIGAAPNTIGRMGVTIVATDTKNVVSHMRYSEDGVEWREWMPYQSPFKIAVSIPVNWSSVRAYMQYRDSAGNISDTCTWEQVTEGW